MKRYFTQKLHISILACLTLFFGSMALLTPSLVQAACSNKSPGVNCSGAQQTTCSYSSAGISKDACCGSPKDCTDLKTGIINISFGPPAPAPAGPPAPAGQRPPAGPPAPNPAANPQCTKSNGNVISPCAGQQNTFLCSTNAFGGAAADWCCADNAACKNFKANPANANPGGQLQNAVSNLTRADVTGICGTGISTALGCLPTETKAFTLSILTWLIGILGTIALGVMLAATVTLMTAGDNHDAIKTAKELFTAAVTGLIFVLFSVTLMRIMAGDILQIPGF